MRRVTRAGRRRIPAALFAILFSGCLKAADPMLVPGISGRAGGTLVYSQRVAPKTFNPVTYTDSASREVINCLMADLVHIDRRTQQTEPALARSWKASPDGLHYTLELRRDVKFSDGHPFDADDVVFSFEVYLDPKSGSAQRDLLLIDGKPIVARKLDSHRVVFDLPAPYAAAERIFDGFAMLPRHLLQRAWRDGKIRDAWSLRAAPSEIAGLGPFRFREYAAGQRIVLERNPYYWKIDASGTALPYLSQISFEVAGSEDLQVLRFQSGEADLISRVSARNFAVLEKDRERRGYELVDAGPGLEYSFLFFNLNDAPPGASEALAARLAVFRRPKFRQAVSLAIDRDAIVKLVYGGRATPIGVPVPAGDRQWTDENLPRPKRSIDQARRTLASDGFTWAADGALIDPSGKKVEFSIATSAGNTDRVQMATLIQDDLKPLGIAAHAAPLEFASLLNRVTTTRDFEGCLLSLSNPDADPNPGMAFWLSSSGNHLWRPEQKSPATAWEAEIDSLMRRQMTERNPAARKRLFDRVQEIAIEQMPVVPLVTPHILAGARAHVRNFRPANMEHYVLWNVETLYLKEK